MDLTLVLLIAVGAVGALQIALLFRRPRIDDSELRVKLELLERQGLNLERAMGEDLKSVRGELASSIGNFNKIIVDSISALGSAQREELSKLTQSNSERLEALRGIVDKGLKDVRADNSQQLEKMRATVDEKLQGTLEKRLGDSFKIVSDRLELVHKGLGEMQTLASGVGDLKRVLTNVKTRGTWGEVQVAAILSEILTPNQYAENVKTNPRRNEIVEFAIKLPGRDPSDNEVVWLPVDSKFPIEDFQRLVEAHEATDTAGVEEAGKMLEARIKSCARDISSKYLNPPKTTDFAIMFLPTESLYAEVARRRGLLEAVQREFRVVVSGPTTFAALLNSLHMGFRTLAIEKRSSEVWKVLGAVKTEFSKFGQVLEAVKDKLDKASGEMEKAASRSRQIEKKLTSIEALPVGEAANLLPETEAGDDPRAVGE